MDGDATTCTSSTLTQGRHWWQVELPGPVNIGCVAVTVRSQQFLHFTIFAIELLDNTTALYKPCSSFEGFFKELRAVFFCNEGEGFTGDFVYIKDHLKDQKHINLCEVQVFPFRCK